MEPTALLGLFGLLGLIVLLALGVPIYAALITVATILLLLDGVSVAGIGQGILDHMNSPALMAVPFFVIAAGFMQSGGIARALIDMAAVWVGRWRSGIPLAALFATGVFAAINGSSVATALAIGTLVVPEMKARGYHRPFALGLTAAAGTLGVLIPPSVALIVYGLFAETSIPRLFLAGIVPGLLQLALFAVVILLSGGRQGGSVEVFPGWRAVGRANAKALPALSLPLIVLGGIYGGFVTVTEAAALSAAVALFVSLFVYRALTVSAIPQILVEGMSRTAAILLIVAGAHLLAMWITRSGLANDLVSLVMGLEPTPLQFLLVMVGILIVLGTVLEGFAMILITLPLTLPILDALGIDRVHYAIILILGIELALLTPPVGLNLFVMSKVANAPVSEVQRGALPFLFAMLVLILAVILFPQLTTALPDFVLGSSR